MGVFDSCKRIIFILSLISKPGFFPDQAQRINDSEPQPHRTTDRALQSHLLQRYGLPRGILNHCSFTRVSVHARQVKNRATIRTCSRPRQTEMKFESGSLRKSPRRRMRCSPCGTIACPACFESFHNSSSIRPWGNFSFDSLCTETISYRVPFVIEVQTVNGK